MSVDEQKILELEDRIRSLEDTIVGLSNTMESNSNNLQEQISEKTGQSFSISCDAAKLLPHLATMNNSQQSMNDAILIIKEEIVRMSELTQTLADAFVHMHDSHYHPISHNAEDGFEVDMGYRTLPPTEGIVARLISELSTGVDKDENGLIYGRDFYLDPNDNSIPQGIDSTHHVMRTKPKVKMTWGSYLSTLPSNIPL